MSSIDQNKIAKNTAMLYIRMAVQTLVSLYTSRVILDALGEVDMGIYNAVGGIVMMFSFLNSTMSTSCQRFFADEMGKGNYAELKRTFSLCVVVFFVIAILIVILSETVGLWFLYNKAKTAGRMDAAKWVFQLSIISFIFTIIKSPYHGIIIIKEKMKVFTYLSFFEVLGNLIIALIISHNAGDRLILYSFLMLVVNIAVSSFYILYCNKFYDECRFKFWWDKQRFMELFGFAGWNMIGSLSVICKSQGLNMLLNMFFGPVINAARTMAYKVYSTVQLFSEYFFTAVKPQILKSYSIGDKQGMLKLVMQSSKFSFFLLFIVSLPILLETDFILNIWLKKVPDYTYLFTQLVMINALIDSLANPLATSMQAYGKIRNYHIVCGIFTLSILPVSYIVLKFMHYPPESVFYTSIIISAIAIYVRAVFVKKSIGLSLSDYFRYTLIPIFAVTITAVAISLPAKNYIHSHFWNNNIIQSLAVIVFSIFISILTISLIGINRSERKNGWNMILNYIRSSRKPN